MWIKKNRDKLRDTIYIALGNKCVRCGFDDYRALQIDHVKGHCSIDTAMMKKSRTIYYASVFSQIKSGSLKYQLLCANCNWIKRTENKEFGDSRKKIVTPTESKVITPK